MKTQVKPLRHSLIHQMICFRKPFLNLLSNVKNLYYQKTKINFKSYILDRVVKK